MTAAAAAPAQADHHEMVISEVYPGTEAFFDSAYIELQMYSSDQNFVGGHQVKAYSAAGTEVFSLTLPDDVANGQNQRTIMIGDEFADGGSFGDFEGNMGSLMVHAGGGACFISTGGFGPIDCVSWGNFSGSLPSPSGTPVAPAGIPNGSSITRSIAPGCSTLLEAGDDSDDSDDDFTVTVTETPQTNTDAVTNEPCPQTTITKKPKKRSTDRTPTFRFKSSQAPATFQCKFDDGAFKDCDSPLTKRMRRGKHTFRVRAEDDPTPARYSWKIVKP